MRCDRLVPTLGLLILAAGLPSARAQSTLIHACVQSPTGIVRIVPATEVCKPGENRVTWSAGDTSGTGTTDVAPVPPAPPWPTSFPSTAIPDHGDELLFLSLAGIQGESLDVHHRDWIELRAADLGAVRSGSRVTPVCGISELLVLKEYDQSSVRLFEASMKGLHLPEATLQVHSVSDTSRAFLEIRLREVLISSYRYSASSSGARPTEEVGLKFAEITLLYRRFGKDGTVAGEFTTKWSDKMCQ